MGSSFFEGIIKMMKTKRVITSKEFEEGLQEFVGKELTDCYYTTDSLVTLLSGKKFPNDRGSMDSEFDLMIWGPWEFVKDGQTIETSFMQTQDENTPNLRRRLGAFIDNLHPTKVTSILISGDGNTAEIGVDVGGKFVVHGHDDVFLNYSHKVFSDSGVLVGATHLRPDGETGQLTEFIAKKN